MVNRGLRVIANRSAIVFCQYLARAGSILTGTLSHYAMHHGGDSESVIKNTSIQVGFKAVGGGPFKTILKIAIDCITWGPQAIMLNVY